MGKPADDINALSQLVNGTLDGDTTAREALFKQLRALAKRKAIRELSSRSVRLADDSDVAQESMTNLIRQIKSLPADCDPTLRAYVFKTVINAVRQLARSQRTRDDAEQQATDEEQRDVSSPSKGMHRKEAFDEVRVAAVTELSAEQREALLLVFGEQLSTADCAMRMQRSEKAITGLIDRAMTAILARVNGSEPAEPLSSRELLRRALMRYLRETSGGQSIDRDAFLGRYPKHAEALSPLLTELEEVRRMLRGPAD